jgi:hypothetical protein
MPNPILVLPRLNAMPYPKFEIQTKVMSPHSKKLKSAQKCFCGHLSVVLGAIDGIEGLVDLVVVPLDGSDSALGNELEGAGLLSRRLGRGATAVTGRGGGGGDDSAGLLRGDVSSRGHCDDVVVGDLVDDLEDLI